MKYETELSAANRKIADRMHIFLKEANVVVTLIAAQSGKSTSSTELQSRMEQLLEQLNTSEEDKRKLTQEKDDLQQQVSKQKDRMLEAERDAGYNSLFFLDPLTIDD